MPSPVEIVFDCLPLRSLPRLDLPLDAPDELRAQAERVRMAAARHGLHNTYYLHNAHCLYRLTNDPQIGMLRFSFEGTVITDSEDRRTVQTDLAVELRAETCDWLTEPVVAWFQETVAKAVAVEFDRFIAAGDLARTVERIEKLRAQADTHGGFLGMGI